MQKINLLAMSITTLFIVLITPLTVFAAFVSGSTGADGNYSPTANETLQIPESGVFNFGTFNIPPGVSVTFRKNSQNTPVTILATGDVTISGTISVNGSDAGGNIYGVGGPGGFDGGYGGFMNSFGFRGQGPGGGGGGTGFINGGSGGGAGFGAVGANGSGCNASGQYCVISTVPGAGGAIYGNIGQIPLIGGSGGGGGTSTSNVGGGGGGGGGAILIASSGTINVTGAITANGGGSSAAVYNSGGGGSGGAVRLVANVITGEGAISAAGGGYSGNNNYHGGTGGVGRLRLEGWQINRVNPTNPNFSAFTYPPMLYPQTIPSLAITQVNGQNVPAVPSGALRTPDVSIPFNTPSPITVTVSALNIPIAGKTVTVKAMPESGNDVITATGALTGTDSSSLAQVSLAILSAVTYVLSASVNY